MDTYIDDNGTEISASFLEGSAGMPLVVYLHGDNQNRSLSHFVTKPFKDRGYSELSFDLPGHGSSAAYKGEQISLERLALTTRNVIERFPSDKIILAGNSTGGLILLKYAIDNADQVNALVMIESTHRSPIVNLFGHSGWRRRLLVPIMRRVYLSSVKKKYSCSTPFDYTSLREYASDDELLEIGLRQTRPSVVMEQLDNLLDVDLEDELHRLGAPILLIHGRSSKWVKKEHIERFKRSYSGVSAEEVEGEHNCHVQNPLAVQGLLGEYIDRGFFD